MKNWEFQKIGDVFTVSSGGTPIRNKPEYYVNGNIPWVKTGDLKGKYVNNPDEFITEEALKNSSAKLFPEKTVLLAMYGATIGACSILPFEAATNQACAALLPSKKCDEIYLYYFLKSFQDELIKMGVGGAQPNISSGKIKQIAIPLPPLDTQKKIAAILDAADAYRQKTKTLIDKYDQLAQSLFLDMFGDPVKNPKGIKIVRLGDVTTKITDGVHAKPDYTESGVPFISVKDVTTGTLKFDDCKFISKTDHEKFTKRTTPEYLDILYTKVGATYGRPAIIDTKNEFSIYVSVALIKPDHSKINAYFLKDALANPAVKRQADKSIKGIGVPDLHLNMIKEFLIPLPDFSLQKQFADRIEAIEVQKQQAQASLQKAEDLFNSLLQRAFKGELAAE